MTDAPAPAPGPPTTGAAPDLGMGGDLGIRLATLPPADAAVAARAEITRLKGDGDFVKRFLGGDPEANARMRGLHEIEANASNPFVIGGPSPQQQRNTEAASLADMGLPQEVIDHYREGKPVSADEYRMAVAKKQDLFTDAAWRAKYFAGNHEAVQQLRLLQVILSSRVAV
jgi:hypothetical protein